MLRKIEHMYCRADFDKKRCEMRYCNTAHVPRCETRYCNAPNRRPSADAPRSFVTTPCFLCVHPEGQIHLRLKIRWILKSTWPICEPLCAHKGASFRAVWYCWYVSKDTTVESTTVRRASVRSKFVANVRYMCSSRFKPNVFFFPFHRNKNSMVFVTLY
jgi:hypothetical protein